MNNLFRKLPKLDILMKNEKLDECREKLNYNTLYTLVKNEIDSFREKIKNREIEDFQVEDIIKNILDRAKFAGNNKLKKVINGSGVIIHTNLGRSVLNKKVVEKMGEVVIIITLSMIWKQEKEDIETHMLRN